MARTLVLGGRGQVGYALVQVLRGAHHVEVADKDLPAPAGPYEFMHVAIPFGVGFEEVVQKAAAQYEVAWVVNHATVPVGTTRRLGENAVHSPVRGQHDDLVGALRRFEKYVAGVHPRGALAVGHHMHEAGILWTEWSAPESTELMKLLCLTRYMNDLAFYRRARRLCERFDVPEPALLQWTQSYNAGYAGTKWVRPELEFPGPRLGGHCVGAVPRLLAEQAGEPWLKDLISEFGEEGQL